MRRRHSRRAPATRPQLATADVIHDRTWPREVRSAAISGGLLFAALSLLDLGLMEPTAGHFVWWAVASGLLLIVLTPPRISAERHGLEARGLFTYHRVRTDQLVSVRMDEGVAQRLVLRDIWGEHLSVDPRILAANPLLWHELDQGARCSIARGTLVCGPEVLEGLGHRIDNAVCQGILEASGLKRPPQHRS